MNHFEAIVTAIDAMSLIEDHGYDLKSQEMTLEEDKDKFFQRYFDYTCHYVELEVSQIHSSGSIYIKLQYEDKNNDSGIMVNKEFLDTYVVDASDISEYVEQALKVFKEEAI